MKTLKYYCINSRQLDNTEYRPLGIEFSEVETEDDWNILDVIENDRDMVEDLDYIELFTETRDGLKVYKVTRTDGTYFAVVQLPEIEHAGRKTMKKNITDRTIDATLDMLHGMPAELAAQIHDVPFEPEQLTEEQKEAIEFYSTLTSEDKADLIEVDGKTYIRKIWERRQES